MSKFVLHPQLHTDTFAVAELALCRCLLMNDSRYPWLVLVPRLADMREFHDVPADRRGALMSDIDKASVALQKACQPHKINVAALGNQVEQLHIHVVARQTDDAAWPNPVWGNGHATPYTSSAATSLVEALRVKF